MKFPFIVKTLRYSVAIFIGMPLNIYVLTRMFKLARKCSDVYSNGVGVCLFIMAVSDLTSLSTITIHMALSVQSYETLDWLGTSVLNGLCKIVVYSQHVSTSLSIWSWLIMSVLRYLSVYHPLVYIRLWQMPTKVLAGAFVVASTANSWLLISVKNNDEGSMTGDAGCTQTPLFESDIVNRVFLLVDCVWSFFIPCAVILFVDLAVFSSSIRFRNGKKRSLRYSGGRFVRHHSLLPRWLLIALIDVFLNAPESTLRFLTIVGVLKPEADSYQYLIIRQLAQVLYYFQFGFNSIYLALFIFDKSTRPSTRRGPCNSNSYELVEAAQPFRIDKGYYPRSSLQLKSSNDTIQTSVTSPLYPAVFPYGGGQQLDPVVESLLPDNERDESKVVENVFTL
uniref:G-protein coupled receptors family 1 profile domain-containing protein n=1 Tax=Pristionchus pacificus TaxID=54126 RepID=A0A8R1YF62_PRIPA